MRSRWLLAGALGLSLAPAITFAQEAETPDVFPAGRGRDEAFYICTGCHGSAIVRQQGLTRDGWNGTIDFMVAAKEMAPLDAETRTLLLDYLSAAFPPRQRYTNPFLNP